MKQPASADDDRAIAPPDPSDIVRPVGRRLVGIAGGITGITALAAAAILLVLDFTAGFLTSGAHAVLSAAPLALIAVAYLIRQSLRRQTLVTAIKALLLAAAFLLWAAYQLFPTFSGAAIFNDLAIGLFVLDVALILGAGSEAEDWA